jgi:hypothetical protein
MKIADLMRDGKESIQVVRLAKDKRVVNQLDVNTLQSFTTSTSIEDIITRVNVIGDKVYLNGNEGLRLMYQLGEDVQVYRSVRAIQEGLTGLITWVQVGEERRFKWFNLFLLSYVVA